MFYERLSNMKTELTIEQSAKLIESGVPKEKASKIELTYDRKKEIHTRYQIFTLADLFDLLPKNIEKHNLHIVAKDDYYLVSYSLYSDLNDTEAFIEDMCWAHGDELIDALYALLLWVIDNHKECLTD